MKELICIVCPRGCHLEVDADKAYEVRGNLCEKGAAYGREELRRPTRVITSTVRVSSETHPRCPVKTDRPVAKEAIFQLMELLDQIELTPPVRRGDLIVSGLPGDAHFVATRDIPE